MQRSLNLPDLITHNVELNATAKLAITLIHDRCPDSGDAGVVIAAILGYWAASQSKNNDAALEVTVTAARAVMDSLLEHRELHRINPRHVRPN